MRFLTVIAIVFFVSVAYATEADITPSRMRLANNTCAASLDTVDVYMVPLEDFPEDISSTIANFMSDDMKLWAKATLRLGALNAASLPGTRQLSAEDIIEKAQPVIQRLPKASAKTYFILLTTQDINSYTGSTRFQFSMHRPGLRTSVVSLARLFSYVNDAPVLDAAAQTRLYKMIKRSIGEHCLGWKRSTNIQDIMYSPIMSVQDIDEIGLQHHEPVPNSDQPNTRPARLPNSI